MEDKDEVIEAGDEIQVDASAGGVAGTSGQEAPTTPILSDIVGSPDAALFLKLQEVLPQHVLMGLMRWMMTISPSVQGLKIAKEQDFSVSWKSMQLM